MSTTTLPRPQPLADHPSNVAAVAQIGGDIEDCVRRHCRAGTSGKIEVSADVMGGIINGYEVVTRIRRKVQKNES